MEYIETVIIGGGQAGLSTSYYLNNYGHEHIVLEKAPRAAETWRKERWDSFTLVTPNWTFKIPGAEYEEEDRDGFMSKYEVIKIFEKYVERYRLPVLYNTDVYSVEKLDYNGYLVQSSKLSYKAKNVVIATGFFQKPKIPMSSAKISPDIFQIHSSEYKNPASVPDGGVLIIGSAQSGCQIAEELSKSGRKIFLSTGTAGRCPRRYRGKDIIGWLEELGFFNLTPEQLLPGMGKFRGIPHISGANGGHTINLHKFAQDGIILLGHFRSTNRIKVFFYPDLHQNLKIVDQFEAEAVKMIDAYIEKHNLNFPPDELPKMNNGYEQPIIEELDLKKEGVNTIIWAMGYTFDYSFVKLPVRDEEGFPIQSSGVTNYPGIYFVGIPWMPSERSGFLIGVGENAGYIASSIIENKTSIKTSSLT